MCLKPKVLLLDDDVLALELYSRELSADYDVIASESLPEFRDYLKHQVVDVLIIEPAIDDDEGWELLAEVRSISNHPVTILCSVEDERRAALGRGADAYLVKPVLPTQLHAIVDQIIATRRPPSGPQSGRPGHK